MLLTPRMGVLGAIITPRGEEETREEVVLEAPQISPRGIMLVAAGVTTKMTTPAAAETTTEELELELELGQGQEQEQEQGAACLIESATSEKKGSRGATSAVGSLPEMEEAAAAAAVVVVVVVVPGVGWTCWRALET